ncbi:MAG: nuclear transport factor 2 family protein [Anaerolineae bacterium]
MTIPHNEFIDRLEISDLLSRYFRAIDDKGLDLTIVEATFLEDGRVVRPNGSALNGWQEILDGQNTSFARFRATHHVITDHVIDIQGDTAKLQANVTAMHLWGYEHLDPNSLDSHFLAGGVLTALAKRTSDGWRFSEMTNRNVWRTGTGFATMLAITTLHNRPDK